jgi:hypothetical protein
MFMTWLETGDQQGESLANEEFRQAVIGKILSSEKGTPILYYKDLGYMSHATIIGFYIENKDRLRDQYIAADRE